MSKFFDDIMAILKAGQSQYGSARKLAQAVEMNPSTLTKWLAEKGNQNQRSPNIRELGPIMDLLGARVVIGLEDCQEKNLQPHALTKELTLPACGKRLFKNRTREGKSCICKASRNFVLFSK